MDCGEGQNAVSEFGRYIKQCREIAGKTQTETARHLNVSCAYLCEVENGTRGPLTPKHWKVLSEKIEAEPRFLALYWWEHLSRGWQLDLEEEEIATAGIVSALQKDSQNPSRGKS
jgi:transcriptional regulator with XRE-family HTH domain